MPIVVKVDENEYSVSDQTINKVVELLLNEAEKLHNKFTLFAGAADMYARKQLYDMEKKLVQTGISKDIAKKVRPENKPASLKLLELMAKGVQEELHDQYAEIGFVTNRSREITDFVYKLPNKSQTG